MMPTLERPTDQPRDVRYWNELGNFYLGSGMYDQSIQAFQAALELDPGSGAIYDNLATVHVYKREYAAAIPLYLRSIELLENNRDKAAAWNRLGNVYRRLNNRRQATRAYQKAKALNNEHASSIVSRTRNSLLSNCLFEPFVKTPAA